MKTYQLAFLVAMIWASPRMDNVDALVLAGIALIFGFISWWREK